MGIMITASKNKTHWSNLIKKQLKQQKSQFSFVQNFEKKNPWKCMKTCKLNKKKGKIVLPWLYEENPWRFWPGKWQKLDCVDWSRKGRKRYEKVFEKKNEEHVLRNSFYFSFFSNFDQSGTDRARQRAP